MTHIAMVKVYHQGEVIEAGSSVDYRGSLDWKYRPADPLARQAWEASAANPERVDEMNRHTGRSVAEASHASADVGQVARA